MDPADPAVVETDIGIGVSTDDDRALQDESDPGAAVVEADQFRFHRDRGGRGEAAGSRACVPSPGRGLPLPLRPATRTFESIPVAPTVNRPPLVPIP